MTGNPETGARDISGVKRFRSSLVTRHLSLLLGAAFLFGIFPALAVAQTSPDSFTIPAGSTLHVVLATVLSSKNSEDGDPFSAKVEEPIFDHGYEVVPAGSMAEGRVSFVKPPGRAKGVAEMRLTIESLVTPDGNKYVIAASLADADGVKVKGDEGTIVGPGKSKKDGAIETGVGAGIGAGVGAIADGGTGALYGAGIGAIAAVVHRLSKRHPDIILAQGTDMAFTISRATTAKKVERGGARAGAASNP